MSSRTTKKPITNGITSRVTATMGAYGASNVDQVQLLLFLVVYDLTFLAAGCAAFPELAVE